MKKIDYNQQILSIPETVWEMDLEQFLDVNEELAKGTPDDLSTQMKLVSILSRIPLSEVEEMDISVFLQLAELCTIADLKLPDMVSEEEAGVNEAKDPIRFSVVDEKGQEHTFNFQPDYAWSKVKYIAEMEDLLKGRDLMTHLHYVLALTAWKDGEVFDRKRIENKVKLMLRAKMEDIYRPLFFFALRGRTSLLLTRIFSKGNRSVDKKERSSPVGVGTV